MVRRIKAGTLVYHTFELRAQFDQRLSLRRSLHFFVMLQCSVKVINCDTLLLV